MNSAHFPLTATQRTFSLFAFFHLFCTHAASTVHKTLICKLCRVSVYLFFHVAAIWKILYSLSEMCRYEIVRALTNSIHIQQQLPVLSLRMELFDHTPIAFALDALRPHRRRQPSPSATCWLHDWPVQSSFSMRSQIHGQMLLKHLHHLWDAMRKTLQSQTTSQNQITFYLKSQNHLKCFAFTKLSRPNTHNIFTSTIQISRWYTD